MSNHANSRSPCALTGRELPRRQLVNVETIRPALADRIRRDHPDLPPDALIAKSEVERYRTDYVEELLRDETGEISDLEQRVAESLATHDTLSENVEAAFEEKRSFGEVVSDHLASFGGSWMFILSFLGLLAIWMAYNSAEGTSAAFDPYPFILLNLVLSCLAALQAPVIMMSQNRQAAKDREAAEHDYLVNLRAELEIMRLHDKLDAVRDQQLMDLLRCNTEILETLRGQVAALAAKEG
jgi:uncharacterized membrane protein